MKPRQPPTLSESERCQFLRVPEGYREMRGDRAHSLFCVPASSRRGRGFLHAVPARPAGGARSRHSSSRLPLPVPTPQ